MKNLKKLSVVLMMTTLISVSFTSCIDNEVSPVVEAIYGAQADLLAAQAAVQNAEATLLEAQAEQAQAQAALIASQAAQVDAITEGIIQDNANQALVNEQELMELAAETALAVAEAQMDLEIAQAEFNIEMAALAAELEAAGAQLATEYAYAYRYAMEAANYILMDKLNAEANLAEAQLMLTDSNTLSWVYVLAMLDADIATANDNKAALEAAIADLETYMADPTSVEAILSTLKEEEDAIDALIDAKEVEMQEKFNEIMAIYEENGVASDFVDRFEDALDELEDAISEKEGLEDDIADAQDDIADWQATYDTYDATVADLEADKTATAAAYDAAVAAADAAQDLEDAAEALEAEKLAELNQIQADIADLYVNLQDAVDLLAALEAGEAPLLADKAAADADLVAAEAAEALVQVEYDLRKANFEADPSGITWFAGADDLLGNHADAITSYIYVVAPVVGGPNTTDTTDMDSADAGTVSPLTGAAVALIEVTNDDGNDVGAAGDYYDFEADDTWQTNADLLNAAVAALDAAKADTAAAQAAVDAAQDALDTYADDLLAAQEDYEYKKGLYEDGVAIEAAAQADYDAAAAAEDIAEAASDAADTAEADALTAKNDAIAAYDAFVATTKAELLDMIADAQADIADWNLAISQIQPIIDAKQAIVDAMQAEYDELIANEGYLSSLQADLHAQIITEWQAYWVLEQELDALEFQEDLKISMINAYGGWGADDLDDLADMLEDLQSQIADADLAIEEAQVALALAQTEEAADEAYLEYLQALIDTLDARYANAMAIAAEYKALMDAALAS
ncbi:hypothetical protein BX611_0734 [Lutibacter oceani]|uniref:Uncharacterized protein n=1 Tax=Lutibacter oceani TaxID=1853311 RepID=A0A3D9RTZ5_9FLAO|nr:hypothetical protein [Lutibacter oceani]REE83443.1 hypothetical protein BX611_0734 [Lutibacter oceani]